MTTIEKTINNIESMEETKFSIRYPLKEIITEGSGLFTANGNKYHDFYPETYLLYFFPKRIQEPQGFPWRNEE